MQIGHKMGKEGNSQKLHPRSELDVSVNPREASVGLLKNGGHRVRHVPLPRPVVALECRSTVHVHWYTAFTNQYGTLAKRAETAWRVRILTAKLSRAPFVPIIH
jgi:hypothetical protein